MTDTLYDRVKQAAIGQPEVFECATRTQAHSIRNKVGRIRKAEEAISGFGALPITTEIHERPDGSAVLIVKHELYGVRLGTIAPKGSAIKPGSGQIDYDALMASLAPAAKVEDSQLGETK